MWCRPETTSSSNSGSRDDVTRPPAPLWSWYVAGQPQILYLFLTIYALRAQPYNMALENSPIIQRLLHDHFKDNAKLPKFLCTNAKLDKPCIIKYKKKSTVRNKALCSKTYLFGRNDPLKTKCAHLTVVKTCLKSQLCRSMYSLQFKTKQRRKYTSPSWHVIRKLYV